MAFYLLLQNNDLGNNYMEFALQGTGFWFDYIFSYSRAKI